MAFTLYNWSEVSVSLNQGLVSAALSTPSSNTTLLQGSMNLFSYFSLDAVATINAVDYFLPIVGDLKLWDVIMVTGSDASEFIQVSAITQPDDNGNGATVTTQSFTTIGSVGTANLVNLAVTTAKIDNLAVTNGKIAAAAVTSDKLDEGLVRHVQVDVSLADFIGSYAASELLIAAPGAGKKIILHRATLAINYGGTVLAGGGASHIQYASTANGAGTKATGTIAAATLIAATADTTFGYTPVDTTLVDSATLNEGLYFAMATADFTGGTSSTYKFDLWYSVVDLA
jgi:hypothetical protein